MPDPKNRILKVPIPAELYDQLEAAATADDRDLERYVVRMVKQYLDAVNKKVPLVVVPQANPLVAVIAPAQTVFPVAPQPPSAIAHTAPPQGAILLATKKGEPGIPIELMSDNSLNGEPEELVNPNVSPVRVPVPNPNAPDMFGSSHRK